MGNTIAESSQPTKQRIALAGVLFIVLLFSYFDRINISVMMADPKFLGDLGLSTNPVGKGMLMSVFVFSYALANILLAPIGDWIGPRKAISICLPLWAISCFVGGIAGSLAVMLFARVLLGIGEGVHWPVQMKYVKNWFPSWERGRANSAWQFGIFLGPAIAMPMFTASVAHYGWRNTFFMLGASTIIPMVLIWFFTRDTPRESKGVNAAELKYIEDAIEEEKKSNKDQAGNLPFGQSVKVFISNYKYWLLVIYFFCNASGMWGVFAWLPSYLKQARGFTWAQMGNLASLPYFAGAVSLFIFGIVTDKFGRRAPFCAIGMLGMSIGLYLAATVSDNMTSAYCLAFAVACNAIALPSTWGLCQQIVPANALGAGSGIMNGIGSLGGALSPIVIGYLIKTSGGSYTAGLMYLVACTFVAAICMVPLIVKKY